MGLGWFNWNVRDCPEGYRAGIKCCSEYAYKLIDFVGWSICGGMGGDWPKLLLSGSGESIKVSSPRHLNWVADELLDSIRYNQGRWLVVNHYLSAPPLEKLDILKWVEQQGFGSWDSVHSGLCLDGVRLPYMRSIFKYEPRQVLFPGMKLGGMTLVEDPLGGEHIQVASHHCFYGFIEREILREEWRRLNHRIPQAAAGQARARL